MKKDNLFKEFPPVSPDEWKEKAMTDLKGADFEKRLVWKTGEGFDVQPFYSEDDLRQKNNLDVCPGDFPFLRGKNIKGNPWLIRQDIRVDDTRDANKKALEIRMKGVDSLGFIFPDGVKPGIMEVEQLLQNIRLDLMELNFDTSYPLDMVTIIRELAVKYNRDLENISGSLAFDPLGYFSTRGTFRESYEKDMEMLYQLIEASEKLPRFDIATVDGSVFHNAGSGIVTQLAFALSKGADYLTYLTGRGMDIDRAAAAMRFRFAVGSNYFMEIAKFRAARYLWANVVNAYGLNEADNAAMFIHCESSVWNKSVYDPYVNMLRTTTETMSSLLGGIDSMAVLPFNAAYEQPTEFSERIARNLQLLLKGESYFDKVNDPAAGSYYIEELTAKLIREAWELFLVLDDMGGYYNAFRKGYITGRIHDEAQALDHDIAQGRRTLLGTNKFPNSNEQLREFQGISNEKRGSADVIVPYRGAQAFEALRAKTDRYSTTNKRPVVWMLTYGNLAMRNARSQFAGNFFGCAGFEIVNNPGFPNIEAGIAAARKAKPDIVVICSSDEEYEDTAFRIIDELKDSSVVSLAGHPKDLADRLRGSGFDNFIHVRSNILQELNRYQDLLKIS